MPQLLEFPLFQDQRGSLTVIEKILPFPIQRVYYIYETNTHPRAGHKHRVAQQALICLHGKCTVSVRGYTESDSRIGIWQGEALKSGQAKPAPKQPNLKKLGDAGGSDFNGCPTTPEAILESRAVYKDFSLDRPTQGLLLDPADWHSIQFEPHSILLVLASHHYSPDDYIYD